LPIWLCCDGATISSHLHSSRVRAPSIEVLVQPFVFLREPLILLGELFQLALHFLSHRPERNGPSQFLFAGQNMLFNQITVFGLRSQFEITIVVVDRLGGISFLLIEQASQFKMCRSGLRIDLKCLFKALDCSWIVHSADPAFSSQKMRLLFLV